MKSLSLAVIAASIAGAYAVGEWAQCGGQNYNGGACDAGLSCVVINDYYHQCQKGAAQPAPEQPAPTAGAPAPGSSQPAAAPPEGNPYTGYTVWLTPYYAAEVEAAAALISDATLKAKALKVKDIPTFTWFDVAAKVPVLEQYLADAQAQGKASGKKMLVQIVVYNLPNRDCHANASNGELFFDKDGERLYQQYIDGIAAAIAKYPDVRVVAVVEPDSLANLVTNLSDNRCRTAEAGYKRCTIYAVQKLAAVNTYLYLDAGHAGWLGWPANLTPAAQMFAQLYKQAGGGIRGLATNVANYNALRAATRDPVTPPNDNYDEIHYINAIAGPLRNQGFPPHFIVDQGRSGVQNIRTEWGNWCNIARAGFGIRPTLDTGSDLIDAIVWIKPGGEADGTSDTSASRYDPMCGGPDAKKPAPEAGTWFQEYFVDLVRNANPAL